MLGLFHLIVRRGGRNVDGLGHPFLELLKLQGTVVQGRGETEAVAHQGLLAGTVGLVHGPDLGDGDVTFVKEHEEVLVDIVQEGGRGLARVPAGEVAGIVFNAVAIADLIEHLNVVLGPLLQTLGLQEAIFLVQVFQPGL